MKPTVYVETSVVSYYCSRPSRDLVVAAHQQITAVWWETRLFSVFEPFVSEAVRVEAACGDPQAAQRRLEAIARIPQLAFTDEIGALAVVYVRELRLPADALPDATHIAYAVLHKMECMATWNCRHIASRLSRDRLVRYNAVHGLAVPTLCTPEELMEESDE